MADKIEEVESKGPNIILIVLGTILITLLLGGGVLFALGIFDSTASISSSSEETAEQTEEIGKPRSPNVVIEEIFDDSVTLRDNSKLIFRIVAEIPKDEKQLQELQRRLSAIQNEIILHISDQNREQFTGRNKKVEILKLIRLRIEKLLRSRDIKITINELYFTKFDLQ